MARINRPPRWLEAARQRTAATNENEWLARALARAGVLPLADAEAAISAGRVKVDGHVTKEPFFPLARGARVSLDSTLLSLEFRTRVLAFNKPKGLITHGTDPEGIGTVFEGLRKALPPQLQGYGWHAVGRLDRDTTGLLLFTNDERFVAHATQPATHLPKRYRAEVAADVSDAQLERLRTGLVLDDGPTRPAQARQLGPRSVELILTEGRFHQVKRMLQAVGLATLALHREAIGTIECDVAEGQYRELSADELRTALGYEPRKG
jgi:23S rRNA pseudouridine2605 synthase/16S rRNA pseudouridine516 synthase